MPTVEQFLDALAMTESGQNAKAWGDNGRAVGRYQVHPDWLWSWAKHYSLQPKVNETWDDFITRVVYIFALDHLSKAEAVRVAMYFHLGHPSLPTSGDWDADYANRFSQYIPKVTNA